MSRLSVTMTCELSGLVSVISVIVLVSASSQVRGQEVASLHLCCPEGQGYAALPFVCVNMSNTDTGSQESLTPLHSQSYFWWLSDI